MYAVWLQRDACNSLCFQSCCSHSLYSTVSSRRVSRQGALELRLLSGTMRLRGAPMLGLVTSYPAWALHVLQGPALSHAAWFRKQGICCDRVESHSAQSISLPQCAMKQSSAVVSLHHGFRTQDCDVTAQLRVAADFRHASQRPGATTERLSIGVDIEVCLLPSYAFSNSPTV